MDALDSRTTRDQRAENIVWSQSGCKPVFTPKKKKPNLLLYRATCLCWNDPWHVLDPEPQEVFDHMIADAHQNSAVDNPKGLTIW